MSDTHVEDDHRVLSVGSMPAVIKDDEKAMRVAFTEWASYVRYAIGSPETRNGDWIVPAIRLLRDNPALAVTRDGDWQTFEDVLNFKVKAGRQFTSDSIDLLLIEDFLINVETFLKLRREFERPELEYQQLWPTDFNYAYFSFGIKGVLQQRKHLRPFTEALKKVMSTIHSTAATMPDPVKILYQIEFPAELVFLAKLRLAPLQALAAPWLARQVLRNIAAVPEGADTGGHTCRGNLNRKSLLQLHPDNVKIFIRLINAITKRWPADRAPMRYIHLPLASAEKPPPLDRKFYLPLKKLKLHPGTRLVAGILHEDLSEQDARQIRLWIEELVGRPVDVAGTCGFGRCSVPDTLAMMRLGAALCRQAERAA